MTSESPSAVGARSELAVASALVRAGAQVYVPLFAPHSRVDLVTDRAGRLLRLQCKTARVQRGALAFKTCSNTANVPHDYRGEVDAFGVYSPDLDRVSLGPADQVGRRGCHLRLDRPRNGQAAGIRWAEDFVVGPP